MNCINWAFRLLIYQLILVIAMIYLIINFQVGFDNEDQFIQRIFILQLISVLFTVVGSILVVLSMTKKEHKNYKFYISMVGYAIILLYSLVSLLFN